MKTLFKTLVVTTVAVVVAAGSARANDLYNNLTTQDPFFGVLQLNNNQPIGQHVFMDNARLAATPFLTNFVFEYYSSNATFSGTVQADVKFYHNNGSLTNGFASPGSFFYDSGWFNLYTPNSIYGATTNVALLSFGLPELYVAGGPATTLPAGALSPDFTVVYTIQGLSGGDHVGLPIFNPSSTGTNYGNYWMQDIGNNWSLVDNTNTPVGIGQRFQATPEPSVLALGALGAVLLARFAKRRQE